MSMDVSNIRIIEKPDWVSWEDIHQVLYRAHEENRSKGMVMALPMKPAEEIAKIVGDEGIMFVTLDDTKVIGTCAIVPKKIKNKWYANEKFAYICFASLLPEYRGLGIFGEMERMRLAKVKELGYTAIYGDTHENNIHRIEIAKKDGFKIVDYIPWKNHYNKAIIKWMGDCPYSDRYINFRFQLSRIFVKLRYRLDEKGIHDRLSFLVAIKSKVKSILS